MKDEFPKAKLPNARELKLKSTRCVGFMSVPVSLAGLGYRAGSAPLGT
jgi:hypothetical protein